MQGQHHVQLPACQLLRLRTRPSELKETLFISIYMGLRSSWGRGFLRYNYFHAKRGGTIVYSAWFLVPTTILGASILLQMHTDRSARQSGNVERIMVRLIPQCPSRAFCL